MGKPERADRRRCHTPLPRGRVLAAIPVRLLPFWGLMAAQLACTFEPGQHFGTLTASVAAGYQVPPDRQLEGGWQKLSNEYQIQITGGALEVGPITLLAASMEGKGGTFNPASPPPGYSNCHNGHCHSDDGRLVPYEEIQAELGEGGAGPQTAVTLSGLPAFDLLVPAASPLVCDPDCGLSSTRLIRAAAPLRRLVLEGVVRDGLPVPRFPGTRSFSLTLIASADAGAPLPTLDSEMDLPVDRDHHPRIRLDFSLTLGPRLFDGVDFAAVGAGAEITRAELTTDPDATARVLENLGESRLFSVVISRS